MVSGKGVCVSVCVRACVCARVCGGGVGVGRQRRQSTASAPHHALQSLEGERFGWPRRSAAQQGTARTRPHVVHVLLARPRQVPHGGPLGGPALEILGGPGHLLASARAAGAGAAVAALTGPPGSAGAVGRSERVLLAAGRTRAPVASHTLERLEQSSQLTIPPKAAAVGDLPARAGCAAPARAARAHKQNAPLAHTAHGHPPFPSRTAPPPRPPAHLRLLAHDLAHPDPIDELVGGQVQWSPLPPLLPCCLHCLPRQLGVRVAAPGQDAVVGVVPGQQPRPRLQCRGARVGGCVGGGASGWRGGVPAGWAARHVPWAARPPARTALHRPLPQLASNLACDTQPACETTSAIRGLAHTPGPPPPGRRSAPAGPQCRGRLRPLLPRPTQLQLGPWAPWTRPAASWRPLMKHPGPPAWAPCWRVCATARHPLAGARQCACAERTGWATMCTRMHSNCPPPRDSISNPSRSPLGVRSSDHTPQCVLPYH